MTKTTRTLLFIAGLILAFGSLWFFCWLGYTGPHWVAFPCFVSGVAGCVLGMILLVASLNGTFKFD